MPPANDDFANAQLVSGGSGSVAGSNVGATQEVGEPAVVIGSGDVSIWYRWVAPSTGEYRFDTIGSREDADPTLTLDTVLEVFTGSSLATLSLVAQDDDGSEEQPSGGGTTSFVDIPAAAGTTYYVRVNGYDHSAVGSIVLTWKLDAAAPQSSIRLVDADSLDGSRYNGHWVLTVDPFSLDPGSDGTIRELDVEIPDPTQVGDFVGFYIGIADGDPVHVIGGFTYDSAAPPGWSDYHGSNRIRLPRHNWSGSVVEAVQWPIGYNTVYPLGWSTSVDPTSDPGWFHPPPVPTITGISPSHGRIGTTVVVSGTHLSGTEGAALSGGGAGFTVISDTEVHVFVPSFTPSGLISLFEPIVGWIDSPTSFTVDPPGIDSVLPAGASPGTLVEVRGGGLGTVTGGSVAGVPIDAYCQGADRVLIEIPNSPGTSGPVVLHSSGGDFVGPNYVIGPLGRPVGRARLFWSRDVGSDVGNVLYEVGAGDYDLTLVAETGGAGVFVNTPNRLNGDLQRQGVIWSEVPGSVSFRPIAERVTFDGTVTATYDPTPSTQYRYVICAADAAEGVITFSKRIAGPSDDNAVHIHVETFDRDTGVILTNHVDFADQFEFMAGSVAVTPDGTAYVLAGSGVDPVQVFRVGPTGGTVVATMTGLSGMLQICKFGDRVAVLNALGSAAEVWEVPLNGLSPFLRFGLEMAGDVAVFGGPSQSFAGFDHDDAHRFWIWSTDGAVSLLWSVTDSGGGAGDPTLFFDHDIDALAAFSGSSSVLVAGAQNSRVRRLARFS